MKFILNLGVAGLLALFCFALPLRAEKPDVRARIVAPPSVAAGATATLVVEMTLGPDWHVNSHTPGEKYLIPTSVTLTTTTGALSPIRYPPHVEKRFAFSEEPMAVYEGTVRFQTDLSLPDDATGEVSIAGTVAFQACNDRQCFPPSKIPLEAKLTASRPAQRAPGR
jgi:DsbC/DsbD-like thiol-disulfide interchange protein